MPLNYPQRKQNFVYGSKSGFIGYLMIRPPGPWRMYWKTLEGLVLWYDFNRCQAIDLSGHGNNGTIYGAQCVQGRSGKALSFHGDDYVDCGNDESLNITDEITIVAWERVEDLINDCQMIVDKTRGVGDRAYGIRIRTDNRIAFFITNESDVTITVGGLVPDLGEWYFVAGTYDGVSAKLYINGALFNEKPFSGNIQICSNNVGIGARSGGLFPFYGTVDEVRIYNRALSEEEIKWLYEHT